MDNSEVQLFNFKGSNVRTLMIDGKPYFVGKDVAEVLGYKNTGSALIRHVKEKHRKTLSYKNYGALKQTLWSGNDYSDKVVINESGLYELILKSHISQADAFQDWLVDDILPAIAKQDMNAITDAMFNNSNYGINALQEHKVCCEQSKVNTNYIFINKILNYLGSSRVKTPTNVYIIAEPDKSYYKIGVTHKDAIDRLAQLKTSNPNKLVVIYERQFSGRDEALEIECSLHKALDKYNVNREWFKLNNSQVNAVIKYLDELELEK